MYIQVIILICLFYRPIVSEHGLWDQVRVDGGREFCLILHIQELLSQFRTNTRRAPYVQTQSKQVQKLCRFMMDAGWSCQLARDSYLIVKHHAFV